MTKNSSRAKTRTPALEAGGGSEVEDENDDDILVMDVYPPRFNAIDPMQDEEREQLLRDSDKHVTTIKVTKYTHQGWITILGFKLPRPLAYLLAIPPLLVLFSLLTHFIPPFIPHHLPHPLLSNGTHSYHPTTLLISLDGFRASYISSHEDLLPNILSLANSTHGLRAESIQPVFPSQTFPNHWSLMTGLYPQHHGIVANSFWDPQFDPTETSLEDQGREFPDLREDKRWWWGEPLWSVVERAGRKAAVLMWPGPDVTSAGTSPSYFVPWKNISPAPKLDQILSWLDLPLTDRPEFIAAYFPDIDQEGHEGGPDSPEVRQALTQIDVMVGGVIRGLEERSLFDIVNLVIVSDHGMASTSNMRLVYLDDILGTDGVEALEHKDGWPSVGLRFKEGTDTNIYLDRLLQAVDNSNGSFAVYTHETMPERWHFDTGRRIAPIYVVPKIGWAITDHHEHEVIHEGDYRPKGNHGYDNIEPEMQAIFLAHGPFVKTIKGKKQSTGFISTDPPMIESFRNLEIFSLVTSLLGLSSIEPAHNGTEGFWNKYLEM